MAPIGQRDISLVGLQEMGGQSGADRLILVDSHRL